MKIAWISHRAGLGGAELSLVEGVKGLVGRGVEVEALLPGPGTLEGRLVAAGASVTLVRQARWVSALGRPTDIVRRLGRNVRVLPGLVGVLRRSRPEVVITNTVTAPLGAVAARALGIPHVWYLHEYGVEDHGVRFDFGHARSLRLVGRLSDAVVVNSQALREHFAPLVGAEPVVVYYAVEVGEPAAPLPDDGVFRLVQVATFSAGKGQEDAVRAVAELARRGVDARLTLLGADPSGRAAALSELARGQGVEDRVAVLGFTEHPEPEVARASVALTCSRREAFGRATVEAMKLGRPVVGTESGGTLELVRDGWNGILYPPGDVSALADRLERLARDPELLRTLASNARTWASETFTLERYADGLLSVLERVRRGRRASS